MPRDRLGGEPNTVSDPVVAGDNQPRPSRLVGSSPLLNTQTHSRQFDGCESLGKEMFS